MKRLIVIDGASSSGRTSLARRFQQVTSGNHRAYHLDDFVRDLPIEVWERCSGSDCGWDEIGRRFNAVLFEASRTGVDVVADCLYKLDGARDHLFALFGRERVFYVQLYCDLAELVRRERARGDRKPGLARSQFEAVYAFTGYDLRIDSTARSIDDCATLLARTLVDRVS